MSGHLSLIFTSCNLEVTLHVPDLLLEPSPEDLKLTNAFMNFVHFLCVFPVVVVQIPPSAFTTLPPRKKKIFPFLSLTFRSFYTFHLLDPSLALQL